MAGDTDLQRVSDHELVEEVLRRGLEDTVLKRASDRIITDEVYRRGLETEIADASSDFEPAAFDEALARIARGELAEAAIHLARAHPSLDRLPSLIATALAQTGARP